MTAKITLTFFCLAIQFSSQATNIVPFWKEDFGSGQIPAGWSTTDIINGQVLWQHSLATGGQNPLAVLTEIELFPNEAFKSQTGENGFAYIFPFQKGAALQNHISYMQTTSIDCSLKSNVFLTFNTFIMAKNSSPRDSALLEVKAENDQTWTAFTIFPTLDKSLVENHPFFPTEPRLQSVNGQSVCLDISAVAANKKNVQIRWVWKWKGAEEYCWLIDDVELLDKNPLDEKAVWGTTPGEGDFSNGFNGWTTPPGNLCNWQWSDDGLVDYPDANDEADGFGCSCTVTNGAAVMNAACNPSTTNNYFAQLISPSIDLSGLEPDKRLGLRFHESGSLGNNNPGNGLPLTSVWISTDGGSTYSDTIFLNLVEPFNKPFCKTTLVPLPFEVVGANEFLFKFVFSGKNFYWIIDDVRVVELFDHDLAISEDYFAVPAEFSSPDGIAKPISFAAEVVNKGNMPQQFVSLYINVSDETTGTVVFRDTLKVGTLEPGQKSETVLFAKQFTPSPNRQYAGMYEVAGLFNDERTIDNKAVFRFNTLGNKFSKGIDRFGLSGGFSVESFDPRYEIGNCYFVPESTDARAVGMEFNVANGSLYFNNGTTVDINLYHWKNSLNAGDVNGDGLANVDEYEKIATTMFTFNQNYAIIETIEVPFPTPVELEGNTHYFVTIDYRFPAKAGGQQAPFFIGASEQINYTAMYEQSATIGQPLYTSMLRKWGEQHFTANAWGLQRMPFVNLVVDNAGATTLPPVPGLSMTLYPNPSFGHLTVEFTEPIPTGAVAFEIFDICGRLVRPRQYLAGFVRQLPLDVSSLHNGVYNLRVLSGDRTGSQRFVVGTRY